MELLSQQHTAASQKQLPSKDVAISFGKHTGKTLGSLSDGYLQWVAKEVKSEWGQLATKVLDERLMRARKGDASKANAADGHLGVRLENYHAFACLVKSCGKSKDLAEARQVHAQMMESEYRNDRFLKNLVVDMYSKCGSLKDARAVFDSLDYPNSISWNIMIAAYGRNGHVEEARKMFDKMPQKNVVSWNAIVGTYAKNGHLGEARSLFEKMGEKNVVSWTTMLTGYAENGHLQEARKIFDKMPEKNVVSWTAMVTGYTENGHLEEARRLFDIMPERNVSSWNTMVIGYASNGHMDEARAFFEQMPQQDVISWTCMVTGYAQNGYLEEARSMFDKMPNKNIVSWNAMITAYTRYGQLQEAKKIFDRMTRRDPWTWTAMVTAYAQNGYVEEARAMFDKMPQRVVVSWNAMVAAYAQNGQLEEAKSLFDEMPQRNVASWNAMISGFAKNGCGKKALALFRLMDLAGVHGNDITFIAVLDACATTPALVVGKIVHEEMIEGGIKPDVVLMNALLNMYGKCGSLQDARSLFDEMEDKDLWSWNVMIAGYAHNGHTKEALTLFADMALDGTQPDEITFVAVLTACSHAGRVDLGWHYFVSITAEHSLELDLDEYVCMIDVLGRSGWLDEAEDLVNSMPFQPDSVAWTTLLGCCRIHGSLERGRQAAEFVFELDPNNSSPYVLLSNLYTTNLAKVDKNMRRQGSFL